MSRGTLRWRAWVLLAAALLLGGCAQLVPQTMALRTDWPAGVPQSVELAGVPFFPQDDYQCGPAALATVLAQTGLDITPESLVPEVYLPARHGSLQVEMLAAARRHGRVSYVLAPRYADLLREVAAGNPVVVLQDVGPLTSEWHYAVVYGFDYPSGTVYLRSGTQERQAMSFTAFERTWIQSGYWAMVAVPPSRIPATATEDAWMHAVLAMARVADPQPVGVAFATALRRWPDDQAAAVGLANHLHAQGDLAAADGVLREARRRHPDSAIVANNLAQVLSDLGRQQDALDAIATFVADAQNPFASDLRSTRELILARMRGGTAAAR
ncbi:PA2778 family cysteine peptidase [Ramlibacter sp. MMS24-I3-19]|uniref:PA2778 family cysteine peptidase n=1 Tax=Ramlibacter sp. MMS24-I3-19 TaxID=3416606 RepID=UPI003D02ECF8